MFLVRLKRLSDNLIVGKGVAFHGGYAIVQWAHNAPTLSIYNCVTALVQEMAEGRVVLEVFSEAAPTWSRWTPVAPVESGKSLTGMERDFKP